MTADVIFDRYLVSQTDLDSGALTRLGVIVHRMQEVGTFEAKIVRRGRTEGSFSVRVDDESHSRQTRVDLSRPEQGAKECACGREHPAYEVTPKGYLVLHVSEGPGGYSVLLGPSDDPKATPFDSTRLTDGDLFAATMIRPGTYALSNELTGAEGRITVAYPRIGRKTSAASKPVQIKSTDDGFDPPELRVQAGQGQVYVCRAPSRIVIRLLEPNDGPAREAPKQIASWSKPPAQKRRQSR